MIIALSASALSAEIEIAIQAGMNGHLSKPFKASALANKIAKILGFNS